MNEVTTRVLPLISYMDRPEGWGRSQGREVYQRLLGFVEDHAGTVVFRVSMKDVKRVDISFASETIIELARRFRRTKGFCLVDLTDPDMIENIDAAGEKKEQPVLVWQGKNATLIGLQPSEGRTRTTMIRCERIPSDATVREIVAQWSHAEWQS